MLSLFGLQTLVRGLLSVLLVVLAIELLGIGEEGVGFLNAAIGAGGLVGAISAITLVGRDRLAPPVLLGLLLWGLPILLIGVVPAVVVAFAALAVLGAGNAVLDISGFTLLQRLVPNETRGRVFGLLEAMVMLTVGVGAALAPVLVELAGGRLALVITGAILPVAAIATWPWMRDSDRHALVPARELALLRGVPMLGALPMTAIEELACRMQSRRFPGGAPIVTLGEVGDRFYVLASGHAEVRMPGNDSHTLGPGDSFGEIALLRDVRRTATVTALEEVETLAIDRDVSVAIGSAWRQPTPRFESDSSTVTVRAHRRKERPQRSVEGGWRLPHRLVTGRGDDDQPRRRHAARQSLPDLQGHDSIPRAPHQQRRDGRVHRLALQVGGGRGPRGGNQGHGAGAQDASQHQAQGRRLAPNRGTRHRQRLPQPPAPDRDGRNVHQHQAVHLLGGQRGNVQRHQATHRMPDHRRRPHPLRRQCLNQLACAVFETKAARGTGEEINQEDAVAMLNGRKSPLPAAWRAREAVQHDQRRSARVAPLGDAHVA
jgi:hypothetical protein